jgi:hypothetical protein
VAKVTASEADSSVLVVVVRDPRDLAHAVEDGWYRIPLARAPSRIAVEYLAFYQTGAFPEGERCLVRWYAPVQDYRIVERRELLPDEQDHPRVADRYYRVGLGPATALPSPIPSSRLRRITFIPTTLTRLLAAQEINDLWIKTGLHERMWNALQQAGLDAECQFEIADGTASYTADFVLPCRYGDIVIEISLPGQIALSLHESNPTDYYSAVNPESHRTHITLYADGNDLRDFIKQLQAEVAERGGIV